MRRTVLGLALAITFLSATPALAMPRILRGTGPAAALVAMGLSAAGVLSVHNTMDVERLPAMTRVSSGIKSVSVFEPGHGLGYWTGNMTVVVTDPARPFGGSRGPNILVTATDIKGKTFTGSAARLATPPTGGIDTYSVNLSGVRYRVAKITVSDGAGVVSAGSVTSAGFRQ